MSPACHSLTAERPPVGTIVCPCRRWACELGGGRGISLGGPTRRSQSGIWPGGLSRQAQPGDFAGRSFSSGAKSYIFPQSREAQLGFCLRTKEKCMILGDESRTRSDSGGLPAGGAIRTIWARVASTLQVRLSLASRTWIPDLRRWHRHGLHTFRGAVGTFSQKSASRPRRNVCKPESRRSVPQPRVVALRCHSAQPIGIAGRRVHM